MALAGFGLDSLIEIGASTVVIWELWGAGEERQRRGLRLIGYAFAALAAYLLVQSTVPAVNFQDVAVVAPAAHDGGYAQFAGDDHGVGQGGATATLCPRAGRFRAWSW